MTGPSDDGQAEVVVTEADRAKARTLVTETDGGSGKYAASVIARALAVERARARALFLAVADGLENDDNEPGFDASPDYWAGLSAAASCIRRAVEEW